MAISATPVDWSASVWAMPNQRGTREAIAKIKVRVAKVIEAQVDDTLIRAGVTGGITFWQKKADILLDWDGTIQSEPACPAALPNCSPNDPENILKVPDPPTIQELARRFPERKGVTVLFTNLFTKSILLGAEAFILPLLASPPPGSPNQNPVFVRFLNIVAFPENPSDIFAHELGHVFQLPHETGFLAPVNLMCGPGGQNFWRDFLLSFLCNRFTSVLLFDPKIEMAMKNAESLKE